MKEVYNLLTDILGSSYMRKNDSKPKIKFDNLSNKNIGKCIRFQEITYKGTKNCTNILISDLFKNSKYLTKEDLFKVILHEYLHSLKSCRGCGHDGEFAKIAQLINSRTDYHVGTYVDDEVSLHYHYELNKNR